MKCTTLVITCCICCLFVNTWAQQPVYKNAKQPVNKRVADLLSRMTLEEKVAQLQTMHAGRPKLNDQLFNNPGLMDSLFKNGMGMMNPAFDETMEQTINARNKLQDYFRTKTRLGIPIIYIDEAHHGLVAREVDVFPHGIGLACSWDKNLLEKIYTHAAKQASIRGTSLVLAPVVDVCRDPRWGRTGETLGEDPYLCGTLGSAIVKGFQGSSDGSIAAAHVAATLKHFAGHGQSEDGDNQGPSNYSLRVIREAHMESFRLCINNAKPAAIMASYNEIDGMPSHANRWLLKDVLRKEWNYGGIVVSDWFGIDQLWNKHFVSPDEKSAALKAFNAGVTSDLPYGKNYRHLPDLVKEKKISMAALDSAVAKVLELKFKLGLFEQGPIDLEKAKENAANIEGRSLALKIAEESMVLLKNAPVGSSAENLLPIKKDQYKKIALVGPMAATNYLGDYSGLPVKNVSLLEGIKSKAQENKIEVLYAKGCAITANGDTISQNNYQYIDTIIFPSKEENARLIDEAVKTAQQSDLVIVAVGENEQLVRETWGPNHFGDMTDLQLQSQQNDLVKAMVATGKPVIVYLMHGRPLAIPWIVQNVPAIVDGWFMGEEAGNAIANILFGDVNPSGKLTITYPKTVGQIPVYYNHKPSAQYFNYVTEDKKPLFPFGYGLSYTSFEYSKPRLILPQQHQKHSLASTEPTEIYGTVEVDVTNTGKMKGDEIVQLYVHQKVSSVTRPVKELKDFTRVTLEPGEKKTLSFTIDASKLAYWNADMQYGVEEAPFEIMVGPNSADVQKVDLKVGR